MRGFFRQLGDPADVELQRAVRDTAERCVLAEEARDAALKDPAKADFNAIVRLQSSADRAVRRLGIKVRRAERPSLAEYLKNSGGQ